MLRKEQEGKWMTEIHSQPLAGGAGHSLYKYSRLLTNAVRRLVWQLVRSWS